MKLFLFTNGGFKSSATFSKLLLVVLCVLVLPVCSFNSEGISNEQSICGNNITEDGEDCDGTDLAGESCISLGFYGGTLSCQANCSGFDTSGCEGYCGDGVINGPEECDGPELDGETCESLGFGGGTLACMPDCSDFDPSGCETPPECGNNIKETGEVCDGTDLGEETCETQGFYEGDLVCETDCSGFDTSGCEGYCGDGIINGDEVCDGDELGGETCETQGFYDGDLACRDNCVGFDTSSCQQEPIQHTLTVDMMGTGGIIEVDGIEVTLIYMEDYAEGTTVTVEAIPQDGWMFVEWIGDIASTEPLLQITMDEDEGIIAKFQEIQVPTSFDNAHNIQGTASTGPADWSFDVIVLDQNGVPIINATGLVVTEKTGEGLSDHERVQTGQLADSMNSASTDSEGKMTIDYTEFQLEQGFGEWVRTQNVTYVIDGNEMNNAIAITFERLPVGSTPGRNIINDVEAL